MKLQISEIISLASQCGECTSQKFAGGRCHLTELMR